MIKIETEWNYNNLTNPMRSSCDGKTKKPFSFEENYRF